MPAYPLSDAQGLILQGVTAQSVHYRGRDALRLALTPEAAQNFRPDAQTTLALLPLDFQDGVIEAWVAGDVEQGAPAFARGFAGLLFRVADDGFEGIYLRPANGRAEDQVRRNHSVQYFSHPGYDFDVLRRDWPEKYEAYADLQPGVWTHMRIEVKGDEARLYLHGAEQPTLIAQDMKRGADQRGGVGLWISIGTEAHFADLRITPLPRD